MDNQLTKEERRSVFHLYHKQEVVWRGHTYPGFHYFKGLLEDLQDETQLVLTPLDKITDEHAIEVAKLVMGNGIEPWIVVRYEKHIYYLDVVRGNFTVNIYWLGKEIKSFYDGQIPVGQDTYLAWQYLQSVGYAVPIYFGSGHWANGKTAFELDIAIDSTQLNDK